MFAIVDKRIPQEAKDKLRKSFELFELESKNIVYPAISGHPDIFVFLSENRRIIAPNAPISLIHFLHNNSIDFEFGNSKVGTKYPYTTHYNAISNISYFIHNVHYTDKTVLDTANNKKIINVSQSYTFCSTFILNTNEFITSDKGILNSLNKQQLNVSWYSPMGIKLKGFQYGFLGGCVGFHEKVVYILGNLNYYPQGQKLRKQLEDNKYKIVELYDGPLIDGGGILIIENKKSD